MIAARRWGLVFRAIAVTIAIFGVLDPQIVSVRLSRPTVAVVAVDAVADRNRALRVTELLEDDFIVIPSRWPAADATVLVGQTFPGDDDALTKPTVVVTPNVVDAPLRIADINVPAELTPSSAAQVNVLLEVADASLDAADILLFANDGITDSVRYEFPRGSPQITHAVALTLPSSALGNVRVDVVARPVRTGGAASADDAARASVLASALTTVRDSRRRVLVYDSRPSFMSTFVRRTLERDPRLNVESRVNTSRNISSTTGSPPTQLTVRDALGAYDLIVVGAPDALDAASVQTLERYLRETGGSVLLLLDAPVGAAVNNLLRVSSWRARRVDQGAAVRSSEFAPMTLRSAEQLWPATLPTEARAIALGAALRADSFVTGDNAAPLLWQTPVGLGAVFVSGALDAWRFRDAERSDFATFWPQLAFHAASRAVPPVSVSVKQSWLAPGERTLVEVTWRDALTQPGTMDDSDTVSAVLEMVDSSDARSLPVRILSTGDRGVWRGVLRAPEWSGLAQLVVTAGDHRTAVPVMVDSARERIPAGGEPLLREWAEARGGWAIADADLPELADSLQRALEVQPSEVQWHPMRSVWWLVPFVLALSAEWWLRRREGLA